MSVPSVPDTCVCCCCCCHRMLCAAHMLQTDWPTLSLSSGGIFSISTFALSLLLVFRTNSSYEVSKTPPQQQEQQAGQAVRACQRHAAGIQMLRWATQLTHTYVLLPGACLFLMLRRGRRELRRKTLQQHVSRHHACVAAAAAA